MEKCLAVKKDWSSVSEEIKLLTKACAVGEKIWGFARVHVAATALQDAIKKKIQERTSPLTALGYLHALVLHRCSNGSSETSQIKF